MVASRLLANWISGIGLGFSLAVLAYVYYVRYKLFPDFSAFWPNKVKGQYVFSN